MYPGPWGQTPPSTDAAVTVLKLDPPPPTWEGREERVALLMQHLTKGEKARLYWLLHQAEGLRLDRCSYVAHQESLALAKQTKKENWP